MKRKLILFLATGFFSLHTFAQFDTASIRKDIKNFQTSLQDEYANPYLTPLKEEQQKNFKGIQFFPENLGLVLQAHFTRSNSDKVFIMETSSHKEKKYHLYGSVQFSIDNHVYSLDVYQSLDLKEKKGYENYLFIPFRDATSGKETYGGGRYLDLLIPDKEDIILNFNLAYQPYCAYTEGYNCPIPPPENTLPVAIKAGVRL